MNDFSQKNYVEWALTITYAEKLKIETQTSTPISLSAITKK